MYKVTVHDNKGISTFEAEADANLLDVLRDNSIFVNSPCGGNGSCGKCRVKVEGIKAEPSEEELEHLDNTALKNGIRLACRNNVQSDLVVYTADGNAKASILTEGRRRNIVLKPYVTKEYVELEPPKLEDQTPDLERLMKHAGGNVSGMPVKMMRKLPFILRDSNFKVTLVYAGGELIGVEAGNTSTRLYGVAFDIGTTTIAAYLYDLKTGSSVDVYSTMNPQRKFGADVLTRIEYTMDSLSSLQEMNDEIIGCINEAISSLAAKNNLDVSDIYYTVFVGNTTMMHFLSNIHAGNIAVAPFIPVTTSSLKMSTAEMGININQSGLSVMFPSVSAYIGADTVAAVLSSGMYLDEDISLLVDIGTNGEIVLGNREWLYSCSAAAGPAFEAANIRNGVGGISGAIDKIKLVPDFEYTTINNEKPLGICGSGIVDAISEMLYAGIIDETGRLTDVDEAEGLSEDYLKRLINVDKMRAFLLVGSDESAGGTEIAVTQKDVRELQNAKAAIAAGIRTLVKRAGIDFKDISHVYLAGGFGNHLNIESALRIGLLPKETGDRLESIGNAAGSGAVEGLLSSEMLVVADEIKARIKYVELSASPDFVNEYVDCMMF